MNIFKKIQANIATIKFYREYDKLEVQGKLEHFDQADLSFLDGKYWQGLPMYYFLTDYMSNGRCYDASIALGLAMGEGAYVVRGDLKSMIGAWGENRLGHGWVEYGDKVYDTTWKIICDRENYYKVFKPEVWSKVDYKTYKRNLKEITDPEIRTKEWYEKNPTSANLLIFQVREIEMLKSLMSI